MTDAQILAANGRFDGAYYLLGYTAELYLKARVCKNLGIDNFFDFDDPVRKQKFNKIDSINRAYRVHDLQQLLILSGVYSQFEQDCSTNNHLQTAWSLISKWNESCRYCSGKSQIDVNDLQRSINIFETWITPHL